MTNNTIVWTVDAATEMADRWFRDNGETTFPGAGSPPNGWRPDLRDAIRRAIPIVASRWASNRPASLEAAGREFAETIREQDPTHRFAYPEEGDSRHEEFCAEFGRWFLANEDWLSEMPTVPTEVGPLLENDRLVGSLRNYMRVNADGKTEINNRIDPEMQTESWFTVPDVSARLLSQPDLTVGALIAVYGRVTSLNEQLQTRLDESSQRHSERLKSIMFEIAEALKDGKRKQNWCGEYDDAVVAFADSTLLAYIWADDWIEACDAERRGSTWSANSFDIDVTMDYDDGTFTGRLSGRVEVDDLDFTTDERYVDESDAEDEAREYIRANIDNGWFEDMLPEHCSVYSYDLSSVSVSVSENESY